MQPKLYSYAMCNDIHAIDNSVLTYKVPASIGLKNGAVSSYSITAFWLVLYKLIIV